MSTISINFLRQRHKELTVLQKADRRYATILGYITVGVVIASVALFGFQFYLASSLSGIKKQQTSIVSQISSLSTVEQEYLTLALKFTEVKNFLKDKSIQQEAIEYFTTVFADQGVDLSEVNREKDGVISFKIAADDVFQIQKVFSFLRTTEVLTKYPSLALSDLSREKSGMYTTTVSVSLPLVSPTPPPKKTIKQLNEELLK